MKKLGIIILALVLALGAIGAGYAYWTANLAIAGTVETGTFSVAFVDPPSPSGADTNPGTETNASIDSNGSLVVSVLNGYPSYTGRVDFQIENTGTVNAKVTSFTIDGDNWDGGAFTVTDTGGNALYTVTASIPAVVEVGTPASGFITIHVAEQGTEGQDAPMGGNFSFQVGINLTQFNAT